jgi:hypothetical protein
MSNALETGITATTLRLAIRTKLSAGGVGRRAVSLLINAYAAPNPLGSERIEMEAPRRPVEDIPQGRRAAFLDALDMLSGDVPIIPFEITRIAD